MILLITLGAAAMWVWDLYHPAVENKLKSQRVTATAPVALAAPKDPFSEAEMASYRQILALFATANYSGALKLAEKNMIDPTASPGFLLWLRQQIPILMTSDGWVKIKTQDCDDALKIFYRALAMEPVPEAQKGLGYCLRNLKNWPEAAGYLASYVLAKPEDLEGRLLYADTLESLGQFDLAVTILEGALYLSKNDPTNTSLIQDKLTAMKAKARQGVVQKTEHTEHFILSYRESDHDALVAPVLDILERALNEFCEVLGITPPAAPIEVSLYRKEDFHAIMPGGPGWAEGVFDGRIRVPVSPDMQRDVQGLLATVLRHEVSHAVLSFRSQGRPWPTWFDEGLAQYLSCRGRACDGFHFPATPGLFTDAHGIQQPFVTLDNIEAGRAYQHSLYLVRAMIGAKGESALDFLSTRLNTNGSITSDMIAVTMGWDSFDRFFADVKKWWAARAIF